MSRKLKCLRCGTDMEFGGSENIQLGRTTWLLGDLPNLFAGSMYLDIYYCTKCGKVEFFAASNEDEDGVHVDESLPQVKCKNCGREYDFDYPKCPYCKNKGD